MKYGTFFAAAGNLWSIIALPSAPSVPVPRQDEHRGRHHKLSGHTWYLIKCHRLTHALERLVMSKSMLCGLMLQCPHVFCAQPLDSIDIMTATLLELLQVVLLNPRLIRIFTFKTFHHSAHLRGSLTGWSVYTSLAVYPQYPGCLSCVMTC